MNGAKNFSALPFCGGGGGGLGAGAALGGDQEGNTDEHGDAADDRPADLSVHEAAGKDAEALQYPDAAEDYQYDA